MSEHASGLVTPEAPERPPPASPTPAEDCGPFAARPVPMRYFLCVWCLYLATRALGVACFAPHNDEVIYAVEAQLIAADWNANKYITVDGRASGDYRPPLLYWITSRTVNVWTDPLVGVRLVALLAGACGFLFSQLLVARLWNIRAALVFAVAVVFSEYYLYFDSIGLNESLLYGLAAVFLYYLLDCLLWPRFWTGAVAAAAFGAMLTTKESAKLWLVIAAFFPFLGLSIRRTMPARRARSSRGEFLRGFVILAAIVAAGWLLNRSLVPARFDAIKANSTQAHRVSTFGELTALPLQQWWNNARFYVSSVLQEEFSYLWIVAALLIVAAAFSLYRTRRAAFWRFLGLVAVYLASVLPVVIVARLPFVRYFGMGTYYLDMILAIAVSVLAGRLPPVSRRLALTIGLTALIAVRTVGSYLPLWEWRQTDLSMRETPDDWANGLGIRRLLGRLKQLPPGLLVCDPAWGHPGSAVRLYRHSYPQLGLVQLAPSPADLATLCRKARARGVNVYFVCDARRPGERPWVDALLDSPQLRGSKEVIAKQFRGRTLEGSRIVLGVCEPTR